MMRKKLTALVLALSLLLGLALPASAAGTFPDVPEDAPYRQALEYLAKRGIFKGDSAGNFNPNSTIKRAETAAILVRSVGGGQEGASTFTDVPSTYWAAKEISRAVSLGLIEGYGGSRFGPEDPVTCIQAVTMLVRMCGYDEEARSRGGYPNGYWAVGRELSLLDGLQVEQGKPASRSQVAVMLYHALVRSDPGSISRPEDFDIDGTTLVSYKGTAPVVKVPDGITLIGERAFQKNQYVEEIILPDSVTSVNKMAFAYTPRLRAFRVGAGLRSMYTCVFTATPKLETFTVASGNTRFYVEDGVLRQRGVSTIYYYPAGKTDPVYVVPDNVKSIQFNANQYLKEVHISATVEKVDLSCTASLQTIQVDPANPYLRAVDNVLYSADMTQLIRYPSAKTDSSFHVPSSVTGLAPNNTEVFPHTAFLTDIYFSGPCPSSASSKDFYHWYSAFEVTSRYATEYYRLLCPNSMTNKVYRIHYPGGDPSWAALKAQYQNKFGYGRYFELEFIET